MKQVGELEKLKSVGELRTGGPWWKGEREERARERENGGKIEISSLE